MKANVQFLLLSAWALVLNGLAPAAQVKPEKTITEIAASSGPAVVSLQIRDASGQVRGKASGFIVDPSGVIVTNFHVIQGGHAVEVKLASGEVYDSVGVVDYNARRDIAILKIKATRLPTVKLGDSDQVKEGERVVAIGNPLGLERTVSDGLVSAWRVFEGTRFIQISVPTSPGSSGGAAVRYERGRRGRDRGGYGRSRGPEPEPGCAKQLRCAHARAGSEIQLSRIGGQTSTRRGRRRPGIHGRARPRGRVSPHLPRNLERHGDTHFLPGPQLAAFVRRAAGGD